MASRELHIIAACTDRKSVAVCNGLRLRDLASSGTESMPIDWLQRLAKTPSELRHPARKVYSGPLWAGALELEDLASGLCGVSKCELWVCSAGYGLVHADEPIAAYAATFVRGHDDSVPGDHGQWWSALASRQRQDPKAPRDVTGLARMHPRAVIIVTASVGYIRAMRDDLLSALDELKGDGALLISSATSYAQIESREMAGLQPHLLPVESKIRLLAPERPSSRGLVNFHAVRHLLNTGIWQDRCAAHAEILRVQSELGADQMPQRMPMSDDAVRAFIQSELRKDPSSTKTRLLRVLRDSNWACEQSRFGGLYREVAFNAR